VLRKLIFTACDFGHALENFAMETVARHAGKFSPLPSMRVYRFMMMTGVKLRQRD
jgi:hypothetical protein